MLKRLLFLLLIPSVTNAQQVGSRFENDTLYTTSGFKIYVGQTLNFGKGTRPDGKFRYVNIKSETTSRQLENNSILITDLKNYGISVLGNGYIEIFGKITFKDGSKGGIDIHVAFDRAIENDPKKPSEIIVPDEFRNKASKSVAEEISRLHKLYLDGVLTKEEFEAQKKKLLNQ